MAKELKPKKSAAAVADPFESISSEPSYTHTFAGIQPDNLLAILCLLGALRCLSERFPHWRVRCHWFGQPLRPVVHFAEAVHVRQVCEAIAEAAKGYAKEYEFGAEKDLNFSKHQAKAWLEEARSVALGSGQGLPYSGMAGLRTALLSDAAHKEDDSIYPPFLCAMFGQGHQHFLERLKQVANAELPKAMRSKKDAPSLDTPDKILEALFLRWRYADETDSFRWDPAEDRRYALRFKNPSEDSSKTVHGANWLGILALPLFASVPTLEWIKGETMATLRTIATARDASRRQTIFWPIWIRPATLSGIRALLVAGPKVAATKGDLKTASGSEQILYWYVSRRFSSGKFVNFSRAEVLD